MALLACAAALLLYLSMHRGASHDRLFLDDRVELTAPPPLPTDDIAAMRSRFAQMAAARNSALSHPADHDVQTSLGADLLAAGDPLTALSLLQSAIRNTAHPAADLYYDLSEAEFTLGLCDRALDHARQMVSAYPRDSRGYLDMCSNLIRLHRRPEAAMTLDQGLQQLAPDDISGRIKLLDEFDANGDTARALKEVRALYAWSPDNPQVVISLCLYLLKSEEPAEARPMLVDLVARDPSNAQAHYELGVVLVNALLPQRDLSAAESELLTAIQLSPTRPAYFDQLGELYLDQGRYKQCAYISLRLLDSKPDSAAARMRLATSYSHLGDQTAAAEQSAIAAQLFARNEEYKSAFQDATLHPADPQAHLLLAQHYMKCGQFSEALPELEAACALAPSSGAARDELAALCRKIGIAVPGISVMETR